MTELRKCSRCRSEILLKYVAINRKGGHSKTCETCLNKILEPVLTEPSDFNPLKRIDSGFVDGVAETEQGEQPQTTEQKAVTVDDDMINTAVRLLGKYSTKQLNQVMRSTNNHI